jgi:uncharacterized membrane protein
MEWLLFALVGYFFYALTNIISKNVVTKHISNIILYAFFVAMTGLIPLVLIPIYGLIIPDISILVISFIAGMLWVYALLPFYKALQNEEVSRLIPIWRFGPFFVLIFSFVLISEVLLPMDFLAFVLLLAGGILISMRKVSATFRLSKGFYLMLLSSIMFSLAHTITKFVYLNMAYTDGFVITRIGSVIAGLTLLCFISRKSFIESFRGLSNKVKFSLASYALFQFAGLALVNLAMSMGPVSLVTSVGGFQTLAVLIIAAIISIKFPYILREELDKRTVLQKIIAIILLLVGSSIIILS